MKVEFQASDDCDGTPCTIWIQDHHPFAEKRGLYFMAQTPRERIILKLTPEFVEFIAALWLKEEHRKAIEKLEVK